MMLMCVGYSCLLTPSDMRVNPRQELFGDEWFGDKVVCAGFETGAFGGSVGLSAQQQHRHTAKTGIRPKSATDLEPILSHQADIEQHDIRHVRSYERIKVISAGHSLQLHVPAREGVCQRPRDAWLVIDEQDARHARILAAPVGRFRHG
jgi:hypothetical protein